MSLKQRYSGLSDEGKTVFWLIIADVLVLVGLLPFFFFSNMGLPLGWLLGAVIVLLCKGTVQFVEMADRLHVGRGLLKAVSKF